MKLVSRIKNSKRIKNILFYFICVLLFFYTFSVPSFGESTSFVRYLIYLAMALLIASTFCYCLLYSNFKIKKAALLIPLFCIVAIIGTIAYSHEFRSWLTLVLLSLSFFAFVYSFKILNNKFLITIIISAAFFAFSIYYIIHYRHEILNYRSYTNESYRLGQFFDNPNGVSAYSIVGLSTSLYVALFWNKKFKYIFVIPTLSSFLVGLTTGSRTFLLIVLILAIVFLYFKFKKHKLIYILVVVGMIVTGILLINLPFFSTLRARLLKSIETIFGTADRVDTSTLERIIMIDYGFYLGSKRLFFGYGTNGFAMASGIGAYAHSNFAEVFCDFGLIGFVVFYSPLIIFLINALFRRKTDKSFVITFVTYYLIVSFTNVLYYKKIYYLVLALLFYFTFIEYRELKQSKIIKSLKRITFVCDTMGSGGAEKVISCLSNEMVCQGLEVFIIGVADLKEPKSFYTLDDRVIYLTLADESGKRINPFKRVLLLRKNIRKIHTDVVISFLPNAIIYTFFSLMFLNIPYVVSERSNPYLNPKNKLTRILKMISFSKADGSVFQTKEAMDFYPKFIKDKGTIIKNPIVLHTKVTKPVNRNKIILSVGRMTEEKNHKCLIDAFSIFNSKVNNTFQLNIYGEGPLKNELIEYCKTKNVFQCVNFLGNRSDWHEREFEDAMYILSSNYEGMPNALAEAMALGIPSISTDCPTGGSRELIKDGLNGYLVPVNDACSLAQKMLSISEQSSDLFFDANLELKEVYSVTNVTFKWIEYIKGLSKNTYE